MDVHVAQVFDALRRPHQCATVQLDFVQASSATCNSTLHHRYMSTTTTHLSPTARHVSASGRHVPTYPPRVRHVSATYPPRVRHVSATYPPRIRHVSTCPQPERFDLKYMSSGGDKEGYERPVMIHRAIMGSFERMIAILTEHYAGKWPLFLSPRQAIGPE